MATSEAEAILEREKEKRDIRDLTR
jgi:hypothetical protein